MESLDKLKRIRVQLQRKNPFFAYLSLSLSLIEKKDLATMGVDINSNLYYNPEFVDKLDEKELMGVMIHEILHLTLLHLIRGKDKNHIICNIADDIVVNQLLKDNNFSLPDGCLWSNEQNEITIFGKVIKDTNKKTSEEIYDEIYEELEKQLKNMKGGESDGSGLGIDGDYKIDGSTNDGSNKAKNIDGHIRVNKKSSSEEIKAKEKEWLNKVQEAYIGSKMAGNVPVGIERFVGQLSNCEINWKVLLMRYIESYIPSDFAYHIPNKKSISCGYFMPDVVKEKINVSVVIDVSGSIGNEELGEFIGEVIGMARAFRDKISFSLYTHETEISKEYRVENGSVGKIKQIRIKGGGGTSHKQVVEYLNKKSRMSKLCVFLTDGFSDINEINFSKNKFESLFVISKNGSDEQLKDKRVRIIKLKGKHL